jgi:hypothetical protein
MTTARHVTPGVVRSLIPVRIDRLPWSPFHTRMVVALGVAWILDGLEITVASAVAAVLSQPDTLNLSSTEVGLIATVYLAGEVVGPRWQVTTGHEQAAEKSISAIEHEVERSGVTLPPVDENKAIKLRPTSQIGR